MAERPGHSLAIPTEKWAEYRARWERGLSRSVLFLEMVVDDVRRYRGKATVLDIGCGRGLDGTPLLQEPLSREAARYLGVEPDPEIPVGSYFAEVHRCALEDAPLPPCSIEVAVAGFVLEHLAAPARFFEKLHEVLVPGGTFWALTVDRRHPFRPLARAMDRLRLKERYLDVVRGQGTPHRVDTYPAFYRANSPRQIARYTAAFRSVEFMGLHRVGELDTYLPRWLRPAAHLLDRVVSACRLPGPVLIVRLAK